MLCAKEWLQQNTWDAEIVQQRHYSFITGEELLRMAEKLSLGNN